jgi:gas vesicle protein
MGFKHFLTGFTIGGICGVAAGLLSANKPGDILRAELTEEANSRLQKVRDRLNGMSGKVKGQALELGHNVELGMDRVKQGFTHAKDALSKGTSAIGKQIKQTAETVSDHASLLQEELANSDEIKKAS